MTPDPSSDLKARAARVMPGGVSSNIRLAEGPDALLVRRAQGARVWDEAGRDYLDYIAGYGAILFGYAPSRLNEALLAALADGTLFSATNRLEIELAEMLVEAVPSLEMVRFHTTGTEAVQTAFRLARAATGRPTIVKFRQHYHGWLIPADAALPAADQETDRDRRSNAAPPPVVTLPWNDLAAAERTLRRDAAHIAGIITEPLMANQGGHEATAGYLQRLRALCAELGILFILDEVITGFRLGLGGAQGYYGVTPDLTTFGKALGGGLPIGAVGGRRDLMALIADGRVNHSGTYNGNALSMAAGHWTLGTLVRTGACFYDSLFERGRALMAGLAEAAAAAGVAVILRGPGPVFWLAFEADERARAAMPAGAPAPLEPPLYRRFRLAMQAAGIRLMPGGRWYVTDAHSNADIAATVARAKAAFATTATDA
jgi:glutamate-1-semialdehyde 2,1-aminomutase